VAPHAALCPAIRVLYLPVFLQAWIPGRQRGRDLPLPAGVLVPAADRHQTRRTASGCQPIVKILGLNAFHGDSSAALLVDGRLAFAIEEERLNRVKHWAGFPALAARACLSGNGSAGVDRVAISRDPRAHFWAKVGRVLTRPGDWRRSASRVKNTVEIVHLASRLKTAGIALSGPERIHFVEHHRAHLASAFFASPFDEAAV